MDAKLQQALNQMRQPVNLAKETKLLRALFYGEPGMGKTSIAAHLIEDRGCIVTTDSSWTVIQKHPDIAEKIDRFEFEGLSQIEAIAQANAEGIEPYASYDTLIWDTASTGVNTLLRTLNERFIEDRGKLVPRPANKPVGVDTESWAHYRTAERLLTDTIAVLNKSKLNIIYLAHLRQPNQQDTEKGKFAIRPAMPEACFKVLYQEVQLLGWLYKESAESPRKVQLAGSNKETAKVQLPGIEEKTYLVAELPELIRKWKTS